jgi:phosphatidylglycerophosphate synthase
MLYPMNGGPVRAVQSDAVTRQAGRHGPLAVGLVVGLLGALAATRGLSLAGWALGLSCGGLGGLWLVAALVVSGRPRLGPADLVTLVRAALACGVAALVADSFTRPAPTATLVGLATTALALDWVDGRVARRTGTVSSFGARFDMEADAFLILVLSVHATHTHGVWVLAIGLARYALLAARTVVPWLRRPTPPRHWCKVVAATQGIVLTFDATDALPPALTTVLLLGALLLLAESFGREVVWLSRGRHVARTVDARTLSRAA